MSLGLMYYLLSVVGSLSLILAILAFLTSVFTVVFVGVFLWYYFETYRNADAEEVYKKIKLITPKAIKITAVLLTLSILTPSKGDLAIITGLNVTEAAVKQATNSDTAAKALELVNQELDNRLEANRKANEGKK